MGSACPLGGCEHLCRQNSVRFGTLVLAGGLQSRRVADEEHGPPERQHRYASAPVLRQVRLGAVEGWYALCPLPHLPVAAAGPLPTFAATEPQSKGPVST